VCVCVCVCVCGFALIVHVETKAGGEVVEQRAQGGRRALTKWPAEEESQWERARSLCVLNFEEKPPEEASSASYNDTL